MSCCSQVSNILFINSKFPRLFLLSPLSRLCHMSYGGLHTSRGFCTDSAYKFRAKSPHLRENLGSWINVAHWAGGFKLSCVDRPRSRMINGGNKLFFLSGSRDGFSRKASENYSRDFPRNSRDLTRRLCFNFSISFILRRLSQRLNG